MLEDLHLSPGAKSSRQQPVGKLFFWLIQNKSSGTFQKSLTAIPFLNGFIRSNKEQKWERAGARLKKILKL